MDLPRGTKATAFATWRHRSASTHNMAVMTKLGLTTNEAKTSLRNARQERFDFLGYSFGAHWFEANGKWYLGASPSKTSVQRLKTRVGDLLVPSNIDPWPEVRDKLNRSLRDWSNYFSYGSRARHTVVSTNTSLNACAGSSREGKGARARQSPIHFRCDSSRTRRSVPPTPAPNCPVVCLAVKPVGKPDAGNRHVRFDERGWETGRWPKGPSYRAHPRLYLSRHLAGSNPASSFGRNRDTKCGIVQGGTGRLWL